jgi:D-lyxose ketol-isomerase
MPITGAKWKTYQPGRNDVYITVYNGDSNGEKLETDVTVNMDGKEFVVPAGRKIRLRRRKHYHSSVYVS